MTEREKASGSFSGWKACPGCGAPRIRSRYETRPGFPGFEHKPDCKFMARLGKRRKRRPPTWNYRPASEKS